MANESDRKTLMVKQAKTLGAYARRFEDSYGVGILDTLVAFHDTPVLFVEGKTITSNVSFGPTERQWIEGERLMKLRGGHVRALLVGWTERGIMYVGEWARVLPLKACNMQQSGDNYAMTLWRFVHDLPKATNQ